MKKGILCLCMAMVMVLGLPMTANAEHFEGSADWLVSFTGEKMESNFKATDAANEVLTNLQPGDSIDLQVNIENKSTDKTDWYMTNEVVKTLEDSNNSAQGGAYTYILTYKAADGTETVIYSSESVGGENILKTEEAEGLHEATATLENHFYLDRLESGQKASVHLFVGLDGETQGNAYQDTLAKLQMNFAVEKVKVASPTVVKGEDKKVEVERVIYAVKTGDNSPIILYSVLMLVSAGMLLVIVTKQLRDREQSKRVNVKGEQ